MAVSLLSNSVTIDQSTLYNMYVPRKAYRMKELTRNRPTFSTSPPPPVFSGKWNGIITLDIYYYKLCVQITHTRRPSIHVYSFHKYSQHFCFHLPIYINVTSILKYIQLVMSVYESVFHRCFNLRGNRFTLINTHTFSTGCE